MAFEYLPLIDYTITLLFLIPFAILDYKKRDIPDKYIYLFLIVAIALGIVGFIEALGLYPVLSLLLTYYLIAVLPIPVVFWILAKLGYIGLADFYILLSLSIIYGNPLKYPAVYSLGTLLLAPLVYKVVILALIIQIVAHYLVTIYKWGRVGFRLPPGLSLKDKLFLLLTSWPLRVREVLEKEFYTITLIPYEREPGKLGWRVNYSMSIEEKSGLREAVLKLLDSNILREDDIIWASYGHPLIVYLAVSFVVYIIVGF
ncbi:A24 family peptidase C-terminal domain-containing protein [Thermogladius sp. 4427co]|uniref:A24 family peptidase C-terminal domain-containing protein n=1 Tax=Thermogladius sp. 4427co TaxID=3450718 RepID=UPI003F79214A